MTDHVTPGEARLDPRGNIKRLAEWYWRERVGMDEESAVALLIADYDSLAAQVEELRATQADCATAEANATAALDRAERAEAQAEQMRAVVEAARRLQRAKTQGHAPIVAAEQNLSRKLEALDVLEEKPPT